MNNYKLIKTYPGSPELGYVIKPKLPVDSFGNDVYYRNGNWIDPALYPEFWKEVKEKAYEILTLECKYSSPNQDPGDVIKHDENCLCNNYYKMNSCFNVHSVKRLSDGEIFSIGDKLEGFGRIKEIGISENLGVWLEAPYEKWETAGCILEYAKKAKPPLFTTFDNVDIFEGDSYYTVFDKEQENKLNQDDNKRWEVYGRFVAEKLPEYTSLAQNCKFFSSIEAANSYILNEIKKHL